MKNNWYVATILIKAIVNDDTSGPWLYDEQIRVIRAPNEEEAYRKALLFGKEEEQSYLNEYGQIVIWEFSGLINLERLDNPIKDGTEIRSHLFHSIEPKLSTMALESKIKVAQEEGCLSDTVDQSEINEITQYLPEASAYTRMTDLFKLLGDPTRLRIVVALFQHDLCVHDLVELLSDPKIGPVMSQSAISHQLRLLRSFQIVRAERQGQRLRYFLIDDHIRELVASSLAHVKEG